MKVFCILFPLESINYVVDVFSDEVDDGLERVVVGLEVEVERPAHEVVGAVGEVELQWCGHGFAVHLDEHAINVMFFVDNQAVADAVGFLKVFGQHGVHVFKVFAQIVFNGFMGEVDGTIEIGHLDVDPVFLIGRIAVVGSVGVGWAVEAVTLDGIDCRIRLFGQVDAEIASWFGHIG